MGRVRMGRVQRVIKSHTPQPVTATVSDRATRIRLRRRVTRLRDRRVAGPAKPVITTTAMAPAATAAKTLAAPAASPQCFTQAGRSA